MASFSFGVHHGASFETFSGSSSPTEIGTYLQPCGVCDLFSVVLVSLPPYTRTPTVFAFRDPEHTGYAGFDWEKQLTPQGIFTGRIIWVLEYGFPEQPGYITCVQLDPLLGGYAGALALRGAFLVALTMFGLPCHSAHQHYRVAMLPPSQAQW